MAVVLALPRYVAIQSKATGKYLCYIPAAQGEEVRSQFQFSEDNITSPFVKFEVHPSKTGDGSLAHFRSCYGSNKYLAAINDSLSCLALEEEDQSKASCTLFRATSYQAINNDNDDDDGVQIRLMHVYLGRYARLSSSSKADDQLVGFEAANPDDEESGKNIHVFKVVNYESVVVLPERVLLKGDNGLYLKAYYKDNLNYLQFGADDVGDQFSGDQITHNNDGSIRLKNNYWNQYWINAGNWVRAESSSASGTNTLFMPIQLTYDTIALKSMRNNLFCKRLSIDGKENFVNASAPSIEVHTRVQVEEHVLKREIKDVNYQLQDARIYDTSPIVLVQQVSTNTTSQTQQTTVNLTHEESRSTNWSNSITIKLGITASATFGVPLISEGKIEVTTEVSNTVTWGTTTTTTTTVGFSATVNVPPNKKVIVKLMATQGKCDVPFWYTQIDTLYDGRTVTSNKRDGLYTGMNSYDAHIVTTEQDI